MNEKLCPVDDLIEIDLPGFVAAAEDPGCEMETFDLDGKKVD